MPNVIPTRIYGFLKEHPPFSFLKKEDLLVLCEQAVVKYFQPEEVIFNQGVATRNCIYIVREGAVHLFRSAEPEPVLVDECDEGDVFGIRPVLADEPYALSAVAAEESLLYEINIDGLRPILENQPKVAWYLAKVLRQVCGTVFPKTKRGKSFRKQPVDRRIFQTGGGTGHRTQPCPSHLWPCPHRAGGRSGDAKKQGGAPSWWSTKTLYHLGILTDP